MAAAEAAGAGQMTAQGQRHREGARAPETAPCIVCAYSPRPCDVPFVQGRLLLATEADGGQPAVLLMGDDGARTSISGRVLRDFVRLLRGTPAKRLSVLTLRVYHLLCLHSAPDARDIPPADADESGQPLPVRRYRADDASVAVLEPDLLFNITDINSADYCVRQYPLRRMVPSPPNAATLRGTLVHQAFKEMLKSGRIEPEALEQQLGQALSAQLPDLALRQMRMETLAGEAEPHQRALASWYSERRSDLWHSVPRIRAETFLLAPEVGLKGRLDFLLHDAHDLGGNTLLELKTSEVRASLPKREHRWQVHGYQTLLAARHPSDRQRRPAALLYSGTPGKAEDYGIPFSLREMQRVLHLRNALALVRAADVVPPPPAATKCRKCALRLECARASALLGWEPPELEELPEPVAAADAAEFRRYYHLLAQEHATATREERFLWQSTPEERCAQGVALGGLIADGEPAMTEHGEWEYRFRCEQSSELREGDAILLSDGDPVRGEVVSGSILRLDEHGVTVWAPERIASPRQIDRYGSDLVHDRTVRNLWRWLGVDERLRALVRGDRAPEFDAAQATEQAVQLPASLNAEQRQAVARALAARDYLLIQGPPGTGKTSVVVEIVRRAVQRGERVLLAAFTNQAVDTVLRRLRAEGIEDFVRLGHALSIAPELHPYRLTAKAAARAFPTDGALLEDEAQRMRRVLREAPVVAATTATWSAERYDDAGEPLRFDLAIVDEATQLTVPAMLGALRFARRFVLVGDERQLPPLVVSEAAANEGLRRSLFEILLARHGETASVRLRLQYRMHPIICAFPSQEFYGGALEAAGAARTALLDVRCSPESACAAALNPDRPLVFVDVPADAERKRAKASMAQAEVVRLLVRELRRGGVAADALGVIAPYRAQVAAIRQRLARDGEREVTVDTVDRFQGGEREVIVFSFGGEASAGVHGGRENFLADAHRLNVALTRAQRKLILVGSRAHLRGMPLLARLVRYCEGLYDGRGGVIPARRN